MVKNLLSNTGDTGNTCLIPGSGRSPGKPLQYSCLENSMDRGAWWAIFHGVTKSRTWLCTHAYSHCKTANIEQYFSNYKQEDWYSHIYIRISGWRWILSKLENWGFGLIGIERSFRTCTEQIKKNFFSFSTDDSKFLSV